MAKGKPRVRTMSLGARLPIGVYDGMMRVMDELRLWSRPTNYIIEAIHEKNQRHLEAIRVAHERAEKGLPPIENGR